LSFRARARARGSGSDPDALQIRRLTFPGAEVERQRRELHLARRSLRGLEALAHAREEARGREPALVARDEELTARREAREPEGDELGEVALDAPRLALLGRREARRVEDDDVPRAPLAPEPAEPLERVAVDEVVRRRIEAVELQVLS